MATTFMSPSVIEGTTMGKMTIDKSDIVYKRLELRTTHQRFMMIRKQSPLPCLCQPQSIIVHQEPHPEGNPMVKCKKCGKDNRLI